MLQWQGQFWKVKRTQSLSQKVLYPVPPKLLYIHSILQVSFADKKTKVRPMSKGKTGACWVGGAGLNYEELCMSR